MFGHKRALQDWERWKNVSITKSINVSKLIFLKQQLLSDVFLCFLSFFFNHQRENVNCYFAVCLVSKVLLLLRLKKMCINHETTS